jgi:N-acetylmuramoyl-L-alanine amidase
MGVSMARWTDIAPRQERTSNQVARAMRSHRGVVIHIAEGSFEGTISWQQTPSAQVSSHFIVDLDGTICQMVDTDDLAWAQVAGNPDWLSIENAGFSGRPLTAAQVAACGRIVGRAHREYGVPLQLADSPSGTGLGHHSMGGDAWGGHYDCPGAPIIAQKPSILAAARGVGTTPEEDDYMYGDLPAGFAIDENDAWLDTTKALPVPTGAVGYDQADIGPAWLYLSSTNDKDGQGATIRYICLPSQFSANVSVDLLHPSPAIGLPSGTVSLLLCRRRTTATDNRDAVQVGWKVHFGSKL